MTMTATGKAETLTGPRLIKHFYFFKNTPLSQNSTPKITLRYTNMNFQRVLTEYGSALIDSILEDYPEFSQYGGEWKSRYVKGNTYMSAGMDTSKSTAPRQRIPAPESELCCTIKPNGVRCKNRARTDGFCGIHMKHNRTRVAAYEAKSGGPASPLTVRAICNNTLPPFDSDDEGDDGFTNWNWLKETVTSQN